MTETLSTHKTLNKAFIGEKWTSKHLKMNNHFKPTHTLHNNSVIKYREPTLVADRGICLQIAMGELPKAFCGTLREEVLYVLQFRCTFCKVFLTKKQFQKEERKYCQLSRNSKFLKLKNIQML